MSGTKCPQRGFSSACNSLAGTTTEGIMKSFISMLALAIAVAVTGPAFAGDAASAKNKADCEAAGGTWNADASTCAAADQQ